MDYFDLPQKFLDAGANAEARLDRALQACGDARTLTEMKRALQRFNLASENYMTTMEKAVEEMERRLYARS